MDSADHSLHAVPPRVTVIIPLYNKAPFIARALDSVLAQTFRGFEVIVVDDGSTDGGPEIVERYRDRRLRLIRQANAGPGAARNHGIRESKAAYVAFCDADDEYLPQFLERALTTLDHFPECDAAATAYFEGSEHTDTVPRWEKAGITHGPYRLPGSIPVQLLASAVNFLWSGSTVCRRDVVLRYGGFYARTRCTWGEDGYLWTQVLLNHPVYRILEPLAWYHTEASELCGGRNTMHPVEPLLTDPEPVRRNCPAEHRHTLEDYLAYHALHAANRYAVHGDVATARELLRRFPLAARRGLRSIKLRVNISIVPIVRKAKASTRLVVWLRNTPTVRKIVARIRGI